MIIRRSNNGWIQNLAKDLSKVGHKQFFLKWLVILLLIFNFISLLLLLKFGQQQLVLFINNQAQVVKTQISTTYHRLVYTDIDQLQLDIAFDQFQKLEKKRQQAIELGILQASDDDFVKAELRFQDQVMPVKLRLKGDWTDHLEGDKWSFRVHVEDGYAFKGMRYFSLQDPQTRYMANEWLFYQVLKQEGLIALRYDFIEVVINGERRGVFAVEEHFSKELIENNQRREGPVIKFNEDRFWEINLFYDLNEELVKGQEYLSEIEPFKPNKTFRDSAQKQQFEEAQRLLEGYRSGFIPAAAVFAIDDWAKLFALSDLFNVRHGLTTFNIRLYYNPITGLIEPIAYDLMIEKRIDQLSIEVETILQTFPGLLEDQDFQKKYIAYLKKYAADNFLINFLQTIDQDLKQKVRWLNRDYYYQFSPGFFYQNESFIQQRLNHFPAIRAQLTQNGQIELRSLIELPSEFMGVVDQNNNWVEDFRTQPPYVYPATKQAVSLPSLINLKNPAGFDQNNLGNYRVTYRLLGAEDEQEVVLSPWMINLYDQRFLSRNKSQVPRFMDFDYTQNAYVVPKGKWLINQDIIIRDGVKLIIKAGAELNLVNSAAIISYKPILFSGQVEDGIRVFSSDGTGQGLVVLDALESSEINYTSFEKLSYVSDSSNNITGSVTFYRSPVVINHSAFINNSAEDMLNLIQTDFKITRSSFNNSFSDAVDVDFSNGKIMESTFSHLTNDAIDVSGSQVEVFDTKISHAGDKGISVGEMSNVSVTDSEINDSNLGFASKDGSELTVWKGNINRTQIGYAVYQKKPEYSPARIVIWNTILESVATQWLIEVGSTITYNGNDYEGTQENVY